MKIDILFWSGGKDSYLALEFYQQKYADEQHELRLLTTYREDDDVIPHQQLPLKTIREQAARLELKLVSVGLPESCPNETYLERIDQVLKNLDLQVDRLVFGDWRNEEIRNWREKAFGELGYSCLFPIWQMSLHELLPVLLLKPVEVKISSVAPEYEQYLKRGEAYNQALIRTLPESIDPMGENGEFHTEVVIHDLRDQVV